nr:hypothetical protein [Tanacetum cinerariifolium]
MRTRSSSNLVGESSPNLTSSSLKCRNRRCSKQPFILEESPVDTMAGQRTMAKLLHEPTEGYAKAIVVPSILAEHLDHYKDLLRACPYHGFTELHHHDTFYNVLNPADQGSLNSAAGGNLLERRTQDVLTIIENKSKVRNSRNKSIISQVISSDGNSSSSSEIAKLTHVVNQQTSAMTTAMTAILKQFQATPPPVSVKAVEEICVTCGGAHPYYQCLVADGNTFSEFWDNIQGYVSAATINYNQVVPLSELEKIKKKNEINIKAMQTQINNNMMASFCQMNTASTSGSGPLPSNTIAKLKGKLKAITTRSGLVLDGPSVPMPPPFINPEEDKRVEETLTDQYLAEYTIKVPPPLMHKQNQQDKKKIQIHRFWQMFKQLHINITLADALILIPKYQKMLKALLSNKEKLLELANTPLNENCLAVILKKLPEKLGDPGKFLISCGFSELKCKALADIGVSINLMPLSVWKILGLPELISTRMTLKLANRAICTPAGIARDVFVSVENFTFPIDFVIVDYESDPHVPLILGRPFLRTAHALIDVHGEEIILCDDYLEDLFATNHLSGNPTFSSHTDLTSPEVINLLSGSTTSSSSSDHLPEEFANKLALITFPPENDDISFDIESDLREIEYFLNHDPTKEMDSILDDSVDEGNLTDPNDNLFDTIPEISSDFLPSLEYDSFLFEDFFEVDALPSTENKDKVFNQGILIYENLSEVTVQETPNKNVKKISISHASLILEDFDPHLSDHELLFHKEVLRSETLLSFSSKNKENVFKPGILTSKGVHTSLLLELSHRGHKAFKVIKIFEFPMKIFPCSFKEDIRILDVPCLHFYPP